ncbi:NACHT domain-containing protein [Actinoplanes sp. CA-015351]|uniref:NACHT domain-containing protein n=1 Tax=Actinoplanes sp. CA-015351 TaxID=3239897 RepID=UPI003D96866B
MWRWWWRAKLLGLILVGVAVGIGCLVVLVRALGADRTVVALSGADADPGKLAAAKDAFGRWTGWANIVALPVGGVGVLLVLVEWFVRSRSTVTDDTRLIAELSAGVHNTLRAELVYRQARNPAPIMVRWSATGRPAAGWDAVLGDGTAGAGLPLILDGDAGGIVTRFRDLPNRQMVILGEPGAGKSVLAMLLALGMLEKPEDDQPVPVLIAVNEWRARSEQLERFLARRLADAYRKVLSDAGDPDRAARWLFDHRRILPILDGLDELPAGERGEAVRQLEAFGLLGHHLVVTSRGAEYSDAVRSGGTILTSAAVVEIEPVAVETATAYLSYPEMRRSLWEPVFHRMRSDADAPVSRALTSALMIALARGAYRQDPHRPSELLGFTRQEDVARRLMDVFVTAAYEEPTAGERPAKARRWLSTIAYHLYERGTRDLHWWEIKPDLLARRPRVARAGTVLTGLLIIVGCAALAGAAVGRLADAVLVALVLTTGVAWGILGEGQVDKSRAHRWLRSRSFGARLPPTTVVACGLATGYLIRDLAYGVLSAVALVLLHVLFNILTKDSGQLDHRFRRLTAEPLSWLLIGINALVKTMFGVAIAVLTGQDTASVVTVVVVYGATATLAAGAWRRLLFQITHLRLVLSGWLPVRLGRFLDDAHRRRAVLRRAGTTYQFRHVLLQDHLALQQAVEQTRDRWERGDESAARPLTAMLIRLGRTDEVIDVLRRRWDEGDRYVASQLADIWIENGNVDQALAIMREAAADSRKSARHDRERLDRLLVEHGRIDELRSRADAGDQAADKRLMQHLTDAGELDEAVSRAISRGDCDSPLVERLVSDGRFEDLRAIAETGEVYSINAYLIHLVEAGRTADAEAWLVTPNRRGDYGSQQLDSLLLEHGHHEAALRRAQAAYSDGTERAALWLAHVLTQQGDTEAAVALLRKEPGHHAAAQLAEILIGADRIDEALVVMNDRPDAVSAHVVDELVGRLVAGSRADEAIAFLRVRVATGRRNAAVPLAGLLIRQGHLDAAVEVTREFPEDYRSRQVVAQALVDRGRFDEAIPLLRGRELVDLLAQMGREEEINTLADAGDRDAESWRIDQMVAAGRADEAVVLLQAKVAGDVGLLWPLVNLLGQQGRVDEATALMRRIADAGDTDAQAWLDAVELGEPFWRHGGAWGVPTKEG